MKQTHGIAIVDDEPAVRVTLRHIFNSIDGFQCCGEYASGEAALRGIPGSITRAVFMDLKLPRMSGLDCTRQLLALMPGLRVIIATACVEPDILQACYRAGALHHLIKPFSLAGCRAAVRLYCDVNSRLMPNPTIAEPVNGARLAFAGKITPAEGAVLECMVAGLSYKMIQERLSISAARLKHLQHRAFGKLGANNQAQAAKAWIRLQQASGTEVFGTGDGI